MSNQRESHKNQRDSQDQARGFAVVAKAIRDHTEMNRSEPHDELQKRDRKHTRIQVAGVVIATIYAGLTLSLVLTTKASVELVRQEQRAWVGPVGKDPVTLNIDRGTGAITLAVPLTNTGKTPALKVHAVTFVFDGPVDQSSLPGRALTALDERPQESEGTLLPGGNATVSGVGTVSNPAEAIEAVTAGSARIYIIGRVVYDDASGVPGPKTEFCYFVGKDMKTFSFCPYFNNAR